MKLNVRHGLGREDDDEMPGMRHGDEELQAPGRLRTSVRRTRPRGDDEPAAPGRREAAHAERQSERHADRHAERRGGGPRR